MTTKYKSLFFERGSNPPLMAIYRLSWTERLATHSVPLRAIAKERYQRVGPYYAEHFFKDGCKNEGYDLSIGAVLKTIEAERKCLATHFPPWTNQYMYPGLWQCMVNSCKLGSSLVAIV